jgi:hypothetical protein
MPDKPISPSDHQYNLLSELHDRLQDIDVYKGYLAQAQKSKNGDWAAVWNRMIEDAESAIAFMRTEVQRHSASS